MRNILFLVVLLFFVSFTVKAVVFSHVQLPAPIESSKLPSAIDPLQLQILHSRFEERKQIFDTHKGDYIGQFELLTDPYLVYEGIELMYMKSLAVDEKVLGSYFIDVGFTPKESGGYRLNLNADPHLVLPYDLFRRCRFKDGDIIIQGLIQKGFRKGDIAILKRYVIQNDPDEEINYLSLDYVRRHFTTLKKMAVGDRESEQLVLAHFFSVLDYHNQYFEQSVWLNWGRGLLASLDPHRQRILKNYLIDNLSKKLSVSPIDPKYRQQGLQQVKEEILSGQFEKKIIYQLELIEKGA